MSSKVKQLRKFEDQNEKRLIDRLDLRPSDGIRGVFRAHGQLHECQIRDISPGGLCLVFPNSTAPLLAIGEVHTLEITSLQVHKFSLKVSVRWVAPLGGNFVRCGCTVVEDYNLSNAFKGLEIPEYFPITGVIYKPYMFYERAPMRVLEISKDFWKIKVYDTEIFAFKGTVLEVYLNTSTSDQTAISLVVEAIESFDTESVTLLVHTQRFPKSLQKWLARYLVFSLNISPADARLFDLSFKNISDGFRFRYIKTQKDYESVLNLRFRAYKAAGKVVEGKTFMDMQAPLDPVSRILGVYHGEKIIASVAVSFPSDDMMLETEACMFGGYTVPMPPRSQVVEVSRLCTDHDYRRTDLLITLFEFVYKTMNCGDRKFIITSSDSVLWPLYKRIGFRKTGMKYDHPYLAGLKHEVIIVNVKTANVGSRINPLAWNYLYRDMASFLQSAGTLRRTSLQKTKVALLQWLGKILRINRREKY